MERKRHRRTPRKKYRRGIRKLRVLNLPDTSYPSSQVGRERDGALQLLLALHKGKQVNANKRKRRNKIKR
jgi:hypothetical protein